MCSSIGNKGVPPLLFPVENQTYIYMRFLRIGGDGTLKTNTMFTVDERAKTAFYRAIDRGNRSKTIETFMLSFEQKKELPEKQTLIDEELRLMAIINNATNQLIMVRSDLERVTAETEKGRQEAVATAEKLRQLRESGVLDEERL